MSIISKVGQGQPNRRKMAQEESQESETQYQSQETHKSSKIITIMYAKQLVQICESPMFATSASGSSYTLLS